MSQGTRLRVVFSRHSRLSIISTIVLCSVFGLAHGQSGRKPPTPRPPATSAPPADSDQPAKPSDGKPDKQRTPIIVTSYLPNIASSRIYLNVVVDGCLERLKQSGAFVITREREMNRKEADDLAKGSTDSFVLWLELRSDEADPVLEPRNPYDLYVDYVLFIPGSGKTKASGHVYQRRVGSLGGPLPIPPSGGRLPIESQLDRAGRETADRVMSALNIPTPR